MKPLALSALQLDALRRNAGQQASAQTAVFVGLALLLEYSNDAFLHFSVLVPEVCSLEIPSVGGVGEATAVVKRQVGFRIDNPHRVVSYAQPP